MFHSCSIAVIYISLLLDLEGAIKHKADRDPITPKRILDSVCNLSKLRLLYKNLTRIKKRGWNNTLEKPSIFFHFPYMSMTLSFALLLSTKERPKTNPISQTYGPSCHITRPCLLVHAP
jgi:hypothetical protein